MIVENRKEEVGSQTNETLQFESDGEAEKNA